MKAPKLNQVTIAGRVTADLEMKYTPSGTAVARFTVAVDKSYKDKNGNWQNAATFIPVTAWDRYAERACDVLQKGTPCIISGRLDTDPYEKNGVKVQNVQIIADSIQGFDDKQASEPEKQPF